MLSDVDVVSQLASVEGQLLDAICKPSSLLDFDARWSSFVSDISKALEAELLTPPTLSLVHTLSHKVSDVFQTLLDLDSLSDAVLSSLGQEVSTITSAPAIEAEMRKRKRQAPPIPSAVSVPAHIQLAHQWLLAHPHDPYPSVYVRDELSRKTGHPRKDIDNWFIETRRRIGWTEMRKTHFSNRRADIIDAAYRAYVNPDPKRPLPYIIHRQFLRIRRCLEDLRASSLSETVLASKLDANFKDLTPQLKQQAASDARRQKLDKAAFSAQSEKATTWNSHHGEDHSCELTSSTCHWSVNTERPERLSASSPFSSEDDYEADARTRKRKRHSSDSLDVGSIKRLRHGQIGPRHHVASDPLPIRNISPDPASPNWYLDTCFPSPAGVEEPDLPSDLELELGDLSSYLRDIYATPAMQSTGMYPQTLPSTNTGLKRVSDALMSCDNTFDFQELCDPSFEQFIADLSGTSSQSLPEVNEGLDIVPSDRTPFLGSSNLDTAIIVDSSFPNLPDTNWLYIPYPDHPHDTCEFPDFCDRRSFLPTFQTMFKQ